jgi:hypothetical protein
MSDFRVIFERVPLMCNNTSAISIAKNPVFHKRMKHLEVRHHFLRDHVEKRNIEMRYIDTERQCNTPCYGSPNYTLITFIRSLIIH